MAIAMWTMDREDFWVVFRSLLCSTQNQGKMSYFDTTMASYGTLCGEDLETWLSQQSPQVGNLVWVCKSKGLKKKKKKKAKQNRNKSDPNPGPAVDSGDSLLLHQQQRLEPFLRAHIHDLNGNDENDGDKDEGARQSSGVDGETNGRITVIYPKGSTYRVRTSHLWPILDPSSSLWTLSLRMLKEESQQESSTETSCNTIMTRTVGDFTGMVVVWPETNEYRRCCVQHTVLLPGKDIFVEVGCDYGKTVAKVADTCVDQDMVLGIDKSTESISIAKQRYPHLSFLQWDLLSPDEKNKNLLGPLEQQHLKHGNDKEHRTESTNPVDEQYSTSMSIMPSPSVLRYLAQRQKQLQTQEPQTGCFGTEKFHSSSLVVAIDINGNRELEAVQDCILRVQSLWQPRLIIVKSRALHQQRKRNQCG